MTDHTAMLKQAERVCQKDACGAVEAQAFGGQIGVFMMRIGLFYRSRPAPRRGYTIAGRLGLLAGVWLPALAALFLVTGIGQARAAAAIPATGGTLAFTAPNVNGVIGGPPGTKVTAHGAGWKAFGNVSVSLSNQPKDCTNVTPVGIYEADDSGAFTFSYNWPTTLDQVGTYYLCGSQTAIGAPDISYSDNSFSLLSSSPALVSFAATSMVAGGSITVLGRNWLPGPQNINLAVMPCNVNCAQLVVGKATVASSQDGTFSESIALSAKAAPGSYYVQASNADGTISAIDGPIPLTSNVLPTATAAAIGTSTPQDASSGGAGVLSSDNKTALKDGLIAAGAGVVVLLALIGGVALLLSRMRGGAELPGRSKARYQKTSSGRRWDGADEYFKQGGSGPPDGAHGRRDMPDMPSHSSPSRYRQERNAAGSASSGRASSGEPYPWERQQDERYVLPPASGRGAPPDEDEEL